MERKREIEFDVRTDITTAHRNNISSQVRLIKRFSDCIMRQRVIEKRGEEGRYWNIEFFIYITVIAYHRFDVRVFCFIAFLSLNGTCL